MPCSFIYMISHTDTPMHTEQHGTFHKSGHDPLPESLLVKSVSEFRICIYYIFPTIPSSLVEALYYKRHYISAAKMSNH